MIKKYLNILPLLTLMLLTACTGDEDFNASTDIVPGDEAINFSIPQAMVDVSVVDAKGSRGTDLNNNKSVFTPGSKFGIYVVDEYAYAEGITRMNSRRYGYANIPAVLQADGSLVPETPILYPYGRNDKGGRHKVAIFAYAPYVAGRGWDVLTGMVPVSVPEDQRTEEAITQSDIVSGIPVEGNTTRKPWNEYITLNMKHDCVRVIADVEIAVNDSTLCDEVEISMNTVWTGAYMDLMTPDNSSGTSLGNVKMTTDSKGVHNSDGKTRHIVATAIVVPQAFDKDYPYMFKITLNNKLLGRKTVTYTAVPDAASYKTLDLKSGTSVTYKIKINPLNVNPDVVPDTGGDDWTVGAKLANFTIE